jgi:hypothetical protein
MRKAAAAKPSLVPVQPKQTTPAPKEVTAAAPSQLGAAIPAARTAAGVSQTQLAGASKLRNPTLPGSKRTGASRQPNTLQRIAKAGHKLFITFRKEA